MKKEGMNASELKELKAAWIKAERLEIMMLVMNAKSIEEAIEAVKQRLKA